MMYMGDVENASPNFEIISFFGKKTAMRFVVLGETDAVTFPEGDTAMKRLISLLLILLLCLPCMAGAEELSYIEEDIPSEPQWTAILRVQTRLRRVKDMNSRDWMSRAEPDDVLDVYYWTEEWCVCGFNGDIGYVPTDRLTEFRSLTGALLPGSTPLDGIATMTQDVFLEVSKYSGNDVRVGDLLCVQESGLVPMMRLTTTLPEGSFTFEPFVPAKEAQPGDAVYGFTTFYNKSLGGSRPANRDFNIELAVERLQGVTIQPGGKFSFNEYCGPYKKSNGYAYAKNVSQDGYGYGGGVCQVSTTIFCAIGGIDYTLDEWQLHSYAGVKYVPRNLDAAVASSRDFSFYNNEAYALDMQVLAQDGVLTVILRRSAEEPAEEPVVTEVEEASEPA